MTGSNCAFYGCGVNRKHKVAIFKIPSIGATDSEHTKKLKINAPEEWLRLILRTREMTADFKKRIEENKVYICERHFKAECILNSKLIFTLLAKRPYSFVGFKVHSLS